MSFAGDALVPPGFTSEFSYDENHHLGSERGFHSGNSQETGQFMMDKIQSSSGSSMVWQREDTTMSAVTFDPSANISKTWAPEIRGHEGSRHSHNISENPCQLTSDWVENNASDSDGWEASKQCNAGGTDNIGAPVFCLCDSCLFVAGMDLEGIDATQQDMLHTNHAFQSSPRHRTIHREPGQGGSFAMEPDHRALATTNSKFNVPQDSTMSDVSDHTETQSFSSFSASGSSSHFQSFMDTDGLNGASSLKAGGNFSAPHHEVPSMPQHGDEWRDQTTGNFQVRPAVPPIRGWSSPAKSLEDAYQRLEINSVYLPYPNELQKQALSIITGLACELIQMFYAEKHSVTRGQGSYGVPSEENKVSLGIPTVSNDDRQSLDAVMNDSAYFSNSSGEASSPSKHARHGRYEPIKVPHGHTRTASKSYKKIAVRQTYPKIPKREVVKIFQCTWRGCNEKFGSKRDWLRHEGPIHCIQETWTCKIKVHSENNGNSVVCEQVFKRDDKFRAHIRDFHGCEVETMMEDCRQPQFPPNQFRKECGFCGKPLPTWDYRTAHIADHYTIDKMDISMWKDPWPRGDAKNTTNNDDDDDDDNDNDGSYDDRSDPTAGQNGGSDIQPKGHRGSKSMRSNNQERGYRNTRSQHRYKHKQNSAPNYRHKDSSLCYRGGKPIRRQAINYASDSSDSSSDSSKQSIRDSISPLNTGRPSSNKTYKCDQCGSVKTFWKARKTRRHQLSRHNSSGNETPLLPRSYSLTENSSKATHIDGNKNALSCGPISVPDGLTCCFTAATPLPKLRRHYSFAQRAKLEKFRRTSACYYCRTKKTVCKHTLSYCSQPSSQHTSSASDSAAACGEANASSSGDSTDVQHLNASRTISSLERIDAEEPVGFVALQKSFTATPLDCSPFDTHGSDEAERQPHESSEDSQLNSDREDPLTSRPTIGCIRVGSKSSETYKKSAIDFFPLQGQSDGNEQVSLPTPFAILDTGAGAGNIISSRYIRYLALDEARQPFIPPIVQPTATSAEVTKKFLGDHSLQTPSALDSSNCFKTQALSAPNHVDRYCKTDSCSVTASKVILFEGGGTASLATAIINTIQLAYWVLQKISKFVKDTPQVYLDLGREIKDLHRVLGILGHFVKQAQFGLDSDGKIEFIAECIDGCDDTIKKVVKLLKIWETPQIQRAIRNCTWFTLGGCRIDEVEQRKLRLTQEANKLQMHLDVFDINCRFQNNHGQFHDQKELFEYNLASVGVVAQIEPKSDVPLHPVLKNSTAIRCRGYLPKSAAEKSFNQADVFRRHLVSVHRGAEERHYDCNLVSTVAAASRPEEIFRSRNDLLEWQMKLWNFCVSRRTKPLLTGTFLLKTMECHDGIATSCVKDVMENQPYKHTDSQESSVISGEISKEYYEQLEWAMSRSLPIQAAEKEYYEQLEWAMNRSLPIQAAEKDYYEQLEWAMNRSLPIQAADNIPWFIPHLSQNSKSEGLFLWKILSIDDTHKSSQAIIPTWTLEVNPLKQDTVNTHGLKRKVQTDSIPSERISKVESKVHTRHDRRHRGLGPRTSLRIKRRKSSSFATDGRPLPYAWIGCDCGDQNAFDGNDPKLVTLEDDGADGDDEDDYTNRQERG